ncbi:glycosyl transferase [uncultured Microbacterium sp.]|uniref:Xanthan biosynthesis glycosyltransferase GumI n=1 Tax=uncultured Microbacterium sp. TaxID=191216 RepID=A0A1Y5P1L3_9MICO
MTVNGRIRVLESISEVKPTTNPYLTQLVEALRARNDTKVELFSFSRAILGRYDVFHVHWPEVTFGGAKPVGRFARRLLTELLMLRLSLTRTPVVRTWHNTERPQGLTRWDYRLLDLFDKHTESVIRLNDVSQPTLDVPVHTVPLGHYREWFAGYPRADPVAGRVSYIGLIRRYKGVEALIHAFRGVETPAATLCISGRPSNPVLAETLRVMSNEDGRIRLRFDFLDDGEFVSEITAASLVVLPFVHMHNSSTVLAALSLERRVLVPDNDVNRRLALEVGDGWIHLYRGELDATDLERALAGSHPSEAPRFRLRDWNDSARLHLKAFSEAARLDR